MKISRTTATQIMTKAINSPDNLLLAVLFDNQTTYYSGSTEEIDRYMSKHQQAVLIFNQHPDAIDYIEFMTRSEGQQMIEIFQDTEGVFGLRAYNQQGKIQTPVTLQLTD